MRPLQCTQEAMEQEDDDGECDGKDSRNEEKYA
jgi:hypothetical protein